MGYRRLHDIRRDGPVGRGSGFARGFSEVAYAANSLSQMYARTNQIIQERKWGEQAVPLAAKLTEDMELDRAPWEAIVQEGLALEEGYTNEEFTEEEYMKRGASLMRRAAWTKRDVAGDLMETVVRYINSAPDNPVVTENGTKILQTFAQFQASDISSAMRLNEAMEAKSLSDRQHGQMMERETQRQEGLATGREESEAAAARGREETHGFKTKEIELGSELRREERDLGKPPEDPMMDKWQRFNQLHSQGMSPEQAGDEAGLTPEEVEQWKKETNYGEEKVDKQKQAKLHETLVNAGYSPEEASEMSGLPQPATEDGKEEIPEYEKRARERESLAADAKARIKKIEDRYRAGYSGRAGSRMAEKTMSPEDREERAGLMQDMKDWLEMADNIRNKAMEDLNLERDRQFQSAREKSLGK